MSGSPIKLAFERAELVAANDQVGDWHQPIPLPSTLLQVPAFEAGMLPSELRAWAIDIAERMQVPLDMVAIPAIIQAGALIGSRIGIRPEANTDWLETCNLWGCVIAPPGAMKSPVFSEVLKPIKRLEMEAAKENLRARDEYDLGMEVHQLQRVDAEREAKKEVKNGCPDAATELLGALSPPKPPAEKRFLTTDATAEKLGVICADNPGGVMVHRDELLTLFQDLDREEKATARGFFLTGWNGSDGYIVDRIGRGTVPIARVNVSVVGTAQPAKWSRYASASLKGHADGMLQRLQLLAWPDFSPTWTLTDRHPNTEARHRAYGCYERLSVLDADNVGAARDQFDDGSGIPFLRFSAAARAIFEEWHGVLEGRIRGDDMPSHLVSHLSKYRGLVPRLALIYHLANGGIGLVSDEACVAALAWAEYLEAHAKRAYAAIEAANTDTARAILRRIKTGDIKTGFTARDVYRQKWSGLSSAEQVNAALQLLDEYEWVRAERIFTAGRPSTIWHINPACSA